ncbi:MAG: hypothetical protein HC927_03565, partial [Deltaproteobacteria bacterium]|nr:hypothetical protein [Deltaproteobacteria bacterium]
MTGLEENVFPHSRALQDDDPTAVDEERRLAYVALTRARRRLSLSFCETRFLWGNTQVNQPSRFLRALPEEALVRFGRVATRAREAERPRVAP